MKNLNHVTNLKQLVRITIDDVKSVNRDDRYRLNVGVWHNLNSLSEECIVCLAGSIMAKTLESDIGSEVTPGHFDQRTEELLLLINDLRMGEEVVYPQMNFGTDDREFDLNNLSELDLDNYDLRLGDIDEWEKLYSDLK